MFTCPPVHMSVCTHVHILICSHVHNYTYAHMFTCTYVSLFTVLICSREHCTHMFTCPPVHVSVCTHVHILVCSHVHTDPSTLEHLLCPHVHWRTYVTSKGGEWVGASAYNLRCVRAGTPIHSVSIRTDSRAQACLGAFARLLGG